MTFDPTGALRRKENSLEIGDSKAGDFGGESRIQRPVKRLGDLVFDEVSSSNLSERHSGQRAACFSAYIVIARAANVQIALFELIGEHEYLAKPAASHRF